ncbi:uncharacterized protein LOC134528377 [Bacillus rossius redtenbacheri]|uniref:uncharacterized protein LOC134528377 n=1 Tax=Bacillus rossius redtenbacheri TaxID=93214 RepID=UPI002FDEAA84
MAGEKFHWTIAATKMLIAQYESHEMLYNAKHNDYKNRSMRVAICKSIAEDINQGCTVEDVRKKINGLRCQYAAEKAKILKSMKSGADADSVYKPMAYWFPMLNFLDASLTPDESLCTVEISQNPSIEEQNNLQETPLHDELQLPREQSPSQENEKNNTNMHYKITESQRTPSTSHMKHVAKKKRKLDSDSYDSLLSQASHTMKEMAKLAVQKPEGSINVDECEAFGNFVISELRAIKEASNDYTFRMAKRKIQHAVMEIWDTIDDQSLTTIMVPSDSTSSTSQWTVVSDQSEVMVGSPENADNSS